MSENTTMNPPVDTPTEDETSPVSAVPDAGPRYKVKNLKAKQVKITAVMIGNLLDDDDVADAVDGFIAQQRREQEETRRFNDAEGQERVQLAEQMRATRKTTQDMQVGIVVTLVRRALVRLPDDLDALIGSMLDMNVQEVEDADPSIYPDVINSLIVHPGFKDFLGSVSATGRMVSSRFSTLSAAGMADGLTNQFTNSTSENSSNGATS